MRRLLLRAAILVGFAVAGGLGVPTPSSPSSPPASEEPVRYAEPRDPAPAAAEAPPPSAEPAAFNAVEDHWQQVERAIRGGSAEAEGLVEEGDLLTLPPGLRNADADPNNVWPGRQVVLDLVPEEWPFRERRILLQALADIERESCIRFVKRTNQSDYLHLRHIGRSCASIVGFHEGAGRVPSFLGSGCMRRGTIQHEMLHTLGLWHEHTRPDRDEHITVLWRNILPGRETNFYQRPPGSVRTLGLPYDYGSVMHYRAVAFSKDGSPTMLPRVLQALPVMGQRIRFSRLDIAKLNTLYNCPAPYYRRENVYLDKELSDILKDGGFTFHL